MAVKSISPVQKARLQAQGYVGYSDEEYASFAMLTRFAPVMCASGVLTGTLLGSEIIIWFFGITAALGALLPYQPFDVLYNVAIRPLTKTAAVPSHGKPRRFACLVAVFWLAATGWLFAEGSTTMAIIFGLKFVAVAGVPVVTGFCIPSWMYGAFKKTDRLTKATA